MSFFYSRFSSAKTSNLVVDTDKVPQFIEGHFGVVVADESAIRKLANALKINNKS